MSGIVDLSLPISHGDGRLGLSVEYDQPYRFSDVGWQGSCFSMFCHHATHVDAPNHFIEGGKSIDQAPLEKLLGPAGLIYLSDHGEDKAITGNTLEERGRHIRRGDIVVLRTDWSDKHWGTETFWKKGPYLDPTGADWLVERGANAVVYDFSEEYVVRNPGFRGEDCIIHHKLLGDDIYNIEYVHRLAHITASRFSIVALPLKLVGLDGSPARVVAVQGSDLSQEFMVK